MRDPGRQVASICEFLGLAYSREMLDLERADRSKIVPDQAAWFPTLFDGITRHTKEGLNFKRRAQEEGWKRAVNERDQGTFDWTRYEPIKGNR